MIQSTLNTNLGKYVSNPRAFTLKKWFSSININVEKHDIIIERIATSLTTDKDVEDFAKLVNSIFELGFRKAVEDYKDQVESLGFSITIADPTE